MIIRRKIATDTAQIDTAIQSRSWRRIAATVSSAVFILVGFGVAPVAYAGPDCKVQGDVTVRGGEARWTKCIGDGWTSVDGWVKDTRKDGKCAQVYARFANGAGPKSNLACPSGEVEGFSWKEPGIGASVYLRTVPTP